MDGHAYQSGAISFELVSGEVKESVYAVVYKTDHRSHSGRDTFITNAVMAKVDWKTIITVYFKYLIEEKNYLDAVIGLPANIFYGTSIPTCILVFKKCREQPDDILFIDASQHFDKVFPVYIVFPNKPHPKNTMKQEHNIICLIKK